MRRVPTIPNPGTPRQQQALETLLRERRSDWEQAARALLDSREEAEDAVSEATERAWMRLGGVETNLAGWFYTILRNICIDRLRRSKRLETVTPTFELEAEPDLFADERILLQQGLRAMPPWDATLLFEYFVLGFTCQEIGKRYGYSRKYVWQHLKTAHADLKARITAEEEGT